MIKVISFDLDGTLADETFDSKVWLEEIPTLYARKHQIEFQDAQDKVFADYYRAEWVEKLPLEQWTDLEYWMDRLQLSDWKQLVHSLKQHVFVYKDVVPTLKELAMKIRELP